MKRLIAVAAMTLAMWLPASLASANVNYTYDSRRTSRHGWIVEAHNYSYYHAIRTSCHWYASGSYWHVSWRLLPRAYKWTTSDAGSWGNRAPRNLSCTYNVLW
jgi:hypothetical protein